MAISISGYQSDIMVGDVFVSKQKLCLHFQGMWLRSS